jgi:hypothetical protein
MQNVTYKPFMLSVVMLYVVMLSVVAPFGSSFSITDQVKEGLLKIFTFLDLAMLLS